MHSCQYMGRPWTDVFQGELINHLYCSDLVMLSRSSLSDNELMMISYKKNFIDSVIFPWELSDIPTFYHYHRFCNGTEDKCVLSCPLNAHVNL